MIYYDKESYKIVHYRILVTRTLSWWSPILVHVNLTACVSDSTATNTPCVVTCLAEKNARVSRALQCTIQSVETIIKLTIVNVSYIELRALKIIVN